MLNFSKIVERNLFFLTKKRELYNERIIHDKVHYYKFDYYRVIPKGKKGIIWITQINNKGYSFFIPMKKNIILFKETRNYNICFDENLTIGKGTILYGTLTNIKNTNYFCCENIYSFMDEIVVQKKWCDKLKIILEMFQDYIEQKHYTKNDIILSIPPIYKIQKGDNILNKTYGLPYDIFSIQYINKQYNSIYTKLFINKLQRAYLRIKANVQNDIYEAYEKNGVFINYLHIPDYKTSIMMNNYFRDIKENKNIDFLEESDTEEDFENINQDKFVSLDKEYIFECVYNNKFELWTPKKKINDNNYKNKQLVSDMRYINYITKK